MKSKMKTSRSLMAGIVALSACGAVWLRSSSTAAVVVTPCNSMPYSKGVNGYANYRVPSVIMTGKGTVLAFAEGRKYGRGDAGDIDVVLRRSVDNGCSWGPQQVVVDHGPATVQNAAPVYDAVTKQVVLLVTGNGPEDTTYTIRAGKASNVNTRRVYQLTSQDDGRTWGGEREITSSVKKSTWRWVATGPTHAIQLTDGKYQGRLVVGANHSMTPKNKDTGLERKYSGSHSIISDDHGKTWSIGFDDATYDGEINTDEVSVAQLGDGRVYFNARNQDSSDPATRAVAWSSTGGATLSDSFSVRKHIISPTVSASVLGWGSSLFYAGPQTTDNKRKNLTIRRAANDGEDGSFVANYQLWPGPAAYSDMTKLPGNALGVLYERGTVTPYDQIGFAAIPLAAIG